MYVYYDTILPDTDAVCIPLTIHTCMYSMMICMMHYDSMMHRPRQMHDDAQDDIIDTVQDDADVQDESLQTQM